MGGDIILRPAIQLNIVRLEDPWLFLKLDLIVSKGIEYLPQAIEFLFPVFLQPNVVDLSFFKL